MPVDSINSPTGKTMFVMDPQGKIYMSDQRPLELHHSSFFSGGEVAAAGEVEMIDGLVVSHSRKSGHYQPTEEQHKQFVSEMNDRGVDLGSVPEDSID